MSTHPRCNVCDQWFMNRKGLKQHREATGHLPRKRLEDSKYHRRASTNGEKDATDETSLHI